jgi:hypothetical protein
MGGMLARSVSMLTRHRSESMARHRYRYNAHSFVPDVSF